MHIAKLQISGYKNLTDGFSLSLSNGLNVLVGENRVGKTALIDAIRLLLIEDEYGRSGVRDEDFHKPFSSGGKQSDAIHIHAELMGLTKQQSVTFLPWCDLEGRAELTLHVDNKPNSRGRYRRQLWGGVSKASAFEPELFDRINCIYLPPLRDAEAKLREGRSSRLARLLKNLNRTTLNASRESGEPHPLERAVATFNEQLATDKDGEIAKANKLIRTRLSEALGTVFSQDTLIQFSEVSFTRIVEGLRLLFFPTVGSTANRDMFRSLSENSLGYNNLLYLATVLAELTYVSDQQDMKVLLIEEPEAHLHPQLQTRLLKYLKKTASESNVQIVVTTHSPVLASSVSLSELVYISAHHEGKPVAIPLRDCGIPSPKDKFVERWLDATKSILLFAKGILLVEGIAESLLMPALAQRVLAEHNSNCDEGKKLPATLEDAGVSTINMGGIYFDPFLRLFCNLDGQEGSNLPVRCAGVTDNDPPKDSKPTPSAKEEGTNYALKLIETVNQSDNCRLYANDLKTLEYDLAMEGGNLNVMLEVAVILSDGKPQIQKQFNEYNENEWEVDNGSSSKADVSYYLLHHIDKGIFAQALAEKLSDESVGFTVPEYIKGAVIWVCGGSDD